MAEQIEHWAAMGQAVEAALTGPNGPFAPRSRPTVDAGRLALVFEAVLDDNSRQAFANELAIRPRYGTDAAFPGWVIRFELDGRLTPGRLVNRRFVPVAEELRSSLIDDED